LWGFYENILDNFYVLFIWNLVLFSKYLSTFATTEISKMKRILFFLIVLFTITLSAQYKNQSVGFIENKGQIIDQKGKPNPAVQYLLNSNGLNVQIKKNGFSYDIYETKKHTLTEKQKAKRSFSSPLEKDNKNAPDYSLEYIYHRVDIDFVDSNPKVELISEEKSTDYDNYYNVPNKPEGVLMVHKFKQITYKNIYPNIDVVFTIPKDSLKPVEYNFVVHPKGKISDIQLKFSGAKTDLVDNKIQMQVRFGEMDETLPMSWTEEGNCKKVIAVGYKKIKKDVYGFECENQVLGKTIIIDPVPVRLWGTYYGGAEFDYATDVFVKDNFVYFGGITYSNRNIASSGAHQTTFISLGNPDVFFAKMNSSDGTRVWGTYYGGSNDEHFGQIKVSNNQNIYVTGGSMSTTNISTSGIHQEIKSNYWDGFLAKFDTNGVRIWGTYYGGLSNEEVDSVVIDANENVYISGGTMSLENIASAVSHQPSKENIADSQDGFIAKFNSQGIREWGTYYGGSSPDVIFDSAIDSNGDLFFMGTTSSSNNIATAGVYQEINSNYDGFLVKFDTDGNRIFGTYFGGNSDDYFYDLGIDSSNNLYCFGGTKSTSNISTPNVFQEAYNPKISLLNGGRNSCIFKLNSNGFKVWGSYFFPDTIGGSVSKSGEIYFTGRFEIGFEATPNAYQQSKNAGTESYLVKFNTNGQREWATFFGGNGADNAIKTAVDDNHYIYLTGTTQSPTNIATLGTYQTNLYPVINSYTPNAGDAFLVKFKDCQSIVTAISNSPICIGTSLEIKASGGTSYAWTGPNGFTSTDQNPIITNATTLNSGQYSCAITGTGGCDDIKTVDVIIGDTVAPIPVVTVLPIIIGDCNTIITTIPTAIDTCAGSITATTTNPLSYSLSGTYTIVWEYDDRNGNSVTQNQTVTITNQPLPSATSPQSFCIQQNATLFDILITGQNIKWHNALTNGNLLANTTLLQNGITYYASQTINGCESERIPVAVNIQNTPVPTANISQSFCSTQNATIKDIAIIGTAIKWYSASTSGSLLPKSTSLQDGITYFATQTINSCESANRTPITISLINTLNATNYSETLCDDQNDGNEIVNFSRFNSNLIGSTTETFGYYTSFNAAENKITTDQITNYGNYNLTLGQHSIYVRIDSPNSCHQIVELQLTLVSKPIINIPDIVPICEKNSVTIYAGSVSDSYLWSNGASTSSIIVSNPGNYSVVVTKNYGAISCSSTKNFTVKKSNKATINSVETKDWTDNNNEISVFVTDPGDFEYSLDGIQFQTSNQFLNIPSGQYIVSVRDKNGCGTATDEVYLLMFPKFFTPNGDGFNDTWKIKFSDIEAGLTVKIFDRYGKLIKTLANNSSHWDGSLDGVQLPASDYWFVVTRENSKEYKGHFSLKR